MFRQRIVHLGLVSIMMVLGIPALSRLSAQPPRRAENSNARGAAPEILPDHRVIFRITAPKASVVTVGGDWAGTSGPAKLEKNDQGVWSVTVGPLVPDFYSYDFYVDGVKTVDPRNPTIKQGINSLDSMFFLPGPEAAFEEIKNVPHGDIRQVWYESSTLGMQRRMHIYTPPRTTAAMIAIPCSTCSTVQGMTIRAGAASAVRALSSITCWLREKRNP